MYEMLKFEGQIQRLEIYDDSLSAFGKSGDAQIVSSAILSGVAESISLSAQTIFLASHSRLHVKSIVLEINGKVCVGQFHRAVFEQGEYVICIVRRLENNLYELYSVLSPKTGLLHMQVGMGASPKTHNISIMKGGLIWYSITIIVTSLIVFLARGINLNTLLILAFVFILFYFIFYYKKFFKIFKTSFRKVRTNF
jgi:hypothetical protein